MILRFFYNFFQQTASFSGKCVIINRINSVFSKMIFLGVVEPLFLLKMQNTDFYVWK